LDLKCAGKLAQAHQLQQGERQATGNEPNKQLGVHIANPVTHKGSDRILVADFGTGADQVDDPHHTLERDIV
jgi:hypothetical protein